MGDQIKGFTLRSANHAVGVAMDGVLPSRINADRQGDVAAQFGRDVAEALSVRSGGAYSPFARAVGATPAGTWQVSIDIRAIGSPDAQHTFDLAVPQTPTPQMVARYAEVVHDQIAQPLTRVVAAPNDGSQRVAETAASAETRRPTLGWSDDQ